MASRSLNKVMLIGNLTRDPELRYTPKGTAVCTFGLATNRSWVSSASGERQEETEFHRIVAWQKLAELCSQLLFKGRKVFVDGRLQSHKWTTSDGQEKTTVEVVIDGMIVLDSRRRVEERAFSSGDTSVKEVGLKKEVVSGGGRQEEQKKSEVVGQGAVLDGTNAAKGKIKAERESEKKEKAASSLVVSAASSAAKAAKTVKKTAKVGKSEEKEEVKADDIPF